MANDFRMLLAAASALGVTPYTMDPPQQRKARKCMANNNSTRRKNRVKNKAARKARAAQRKRGK